MENEDYVSEVSKEYQIKGYEIFNEGCFPLLEEIVKKEETNIGAKLFMIYLGLINTIFRNIVNQYGIKVALKMQNLIARELNFIQKEIKDSKDKIQ